MGLAFSLESPLLKVWQSLKARQSKQWEAQAAAEAQAEAGTQRPAIAQLRAKANAVKRMRPRGAAARAASSSDSLGGGGVLVGVGDAVPMSRGAPPPPPPPSSLGESSRAQRLRSRVTGARPKAPTCVSTSSSSSIDGALVAPTASCVASEPSYNVALSMPVQALSPPPPPPQAGPNLMDIIASGAVAAPSALARARLANKRKFPKLPTTFRRKSSIPLPPPMLPQESSNSGSLRIDDLPEPSLAPPPPPPMPPPEDEPRVYI